MLEALITEFEAVEDPRDPCRVEHRLIDILVIAVCAVLGAAESFEDMADYGRCKHDWLKRFLALPNGIPSHDTFRRVLMLIDRRGAAVPDAQGALPDRRSGGVARGGHRDRPPGDAGVRLHAGADRRPPGLPRDALSPRRGPGQRGRSERM